MQALHLITTAIYVPLVLVSRPLLYLLRVFVACLCLPLKFAARFEVTT
jgi:hypothetical protein